MDTEMEPLEGAIGGEASPEQVGQEDLFRQKDEEILRLQEQVKRVAAESENFRRRLEADRERRVDMARDDFLRSVLPVLDHLDRALVAVREGGGLEALVQGVELVQRDALKILEGHGVQPIEVLGSQFDPSLHEAVLVEQREDVPDETVVEELQRGYRVRERLLRPSWVKVARHPAEG